MRNLKEEALLTLIMKHVGEGASESEERILMEWADADPKNRAFLDEILDDEAMQAELQRWRSLDPAVGYNKWMERREKRKRGLVRRLGYAVAAACTIGTIAAFWFLHKPATSESIPNLIAKEQSRRMDHNKAVLTLGDGTRVLLDSAVNGVLAVQGMTKLMKTGGDISYMPVSNGVGNADVINILSTPNAGMFRLVLPDGSRVWLNNASRLRYPVAFNGNQRIVELEGEAFFEVETDVKRPFTVKTGQLSVEVLGTSFNITAYKDEKGIRTTLVSGAVRVSKGGKIVRLRPNDQAQLDSTDVINVSHDVAAQDVISWKDGFFYFDKTPLKDVMRQVARWYDVKVMFRQGMVYDQEFSGKLDRNLQLDDLIKFLERNQVHAQIAGNTVYVN